MPNGEKSGCHDGQVSEANDASGGTSTMSNEQPSAAESSARAAQGFSLLAEMTGGLAHDFRNILTVIDSGLRLAEKHSNDPRSASVFIAGAREGVARGLTLTSQLLAVAKQREVQARASNVNQLLKALELFLRYGAGSDVRVVLELSPNIPNCLVDPSQFNAAILNLVINARDAMPNGGEIRISTVPWVAQDDASDAAQGHFVHLRVRDSGTGMSDEVLQKIFHTFFTTKGEQGTGLGVPQVGALMRHIGGYVRVTSDLRRGTTFDLFFPAVEPNGARARHIDIKVAPPARLVDAPSSERLSPTAELRVL